MYYNQYYQLSARFIYFKRPDEKVISEIANQIGALEEESDKLDALSSVFSKYRVEYGLRVAEVLQFDKQETITAVLKSDRRDIAQILAKQSRERRSNLRGKDKRLIEESFEKLKGGNLVSANLDSDERINRAMNERQRRESESPDIKIKRLAKEEQRRKFDRSVQALIGKDIPVIDPLLDISDFSPSMYAGERLLKDILNGGTTNVILGKAGIRKEVLGRLKKEEEVYEIMNSKLKQSDIDSIHVNTVNVKGLPYLFLFFNSGEAIIIGKGGRIYGPIVHIPRDQDTKYKKDNEGFVKVIVKRNHKEIVIDEDFNESEEYESLYDLDYAEDGTYYYVGKKENGKYVVADSRRNLSQEFEFISEIIKTPGGGYLYLATEGKISYLIDENGMVLRKFPPNISIPRNCIQPMLGGKYVLQFSDDRKSYVEDGRGRKSKPYRMIGELKTKPKDGYVFVAYQENLKNCFLVDEKATESEVFDDIDSRSLQITESGYLVICRKGDSSMIVSEKGVIGKEYRAIRDLILRPDGTFCYIGVKDNGEVIVGQDGNESELFDSISDLKSTNDNGYVFLGNKGKAIFIVDDKKNKSKNYERDLFGFNSILLRKDGGYAYVGQRSDGKYELLDNEGNMSNPYGCINDFTALDDNGYVCIAKKNSIYDESEVVVDDMQRESPEYKKVHYIRPKDGGGYVFFAEKLNGIFVYVDEDFNEIPVDRNIVANFDGEPDEVFTTEAFFENDLVCFKSNGQAFLSYKYSQRRNDLIDILDKYVRGEGFDLEDINEYFLRNYSGNKRKSYAITRYRKQLEKEVFSLLHTLFPYTKKKSVLRKVLTRRMGNSNTEAPGINQTLPIFAERTLSDGDPKDGKGELFLEIEPALENDQMIIDRFYMLSDLKGSMQTITKPLNSENKNFAKEYNFRVKVPKNNSGNSAISLPRLNNSKIEDAYLIKQDGVKVEAQVHFNQSEGVYYISNIPSGVVTVEYKVKVLEDGTSYEKLDENYSEIAEQFKEYNELLNSIELPCFIQDFLDSIKDRNILEKIKLIKSFVSKYGVYDMDSATAKSQGINSIQDRVDLMFSRAQEIKTFGIHKPLFAGICTDFAILTHLMLSQVGISSCLESGFQTNFSGNKSYSKMQHLAVGVILPNNNNGYNIAHLDTTPAANQMIELMKTLKDSPALFLSLFAYISNLFKIQERLQEDASEQQDLDQGNNDKVNNIEDSDGATLENDDEENLLEPLISSESPNIELKINNISIQIPEDIFCVLYSVIDYLTYSRFLSENRNNFADFDVDQILLLYNSIERSNIIYDQQLLFARIKTLKERRVEDLYKFLESTFNNNKIKTQINLPGNMSEILNKILENIS